MTEHRSKMTEKPFERYFYKEYSPIRAGNIDGMTSKFKKFRNHTFLLNYAL